jgi:hypothetical protein
MKKKQKLNRELTRMDAKLVTGRMRSMWPTSAMGFGRVRLQTFVGNGRIPGFEAM